MADSLFNSNPIDMMQATPQSALQNQFMQTPGYQLFQGQNGNAQSPLNSFTNSPMFQLMYGNNTNADPSQRFLNDPGTQLAVQQGMVPLQQSLAARGLGQSGAAARSMADYMYGQYGNYIGQQGNALNNYQNTVNSLFGNYQNQLSGMSQMGMQSSGANNAFAAGQNQANTIAQGNLQTGSNVSSLFGNQGVYNANAYLNTGAAQANNLFNGAGMLAQVNQNAIAGQNSQQASLFGGMGQASGMSGGRMF